MVALATLFLCTGLAQDAPKKGIQKRRSERGDAKVAPEYPAIAKQLKIEGSVELEVLVAESGT